MSSSGESTTEAEWARFNDGEWLEAAFSLSSDGLVIRQGVAAPPLLVRWSTIAKVEALGATTAPIVQISIALTDGHIVGAHVRQATLGPFIAALQRQSQGHSPSPSASSPMAGAALGQRFSGGASSPSVGAQLPPALGTAPVPRKQGRIWKVTAALVGLVVLGAAATVVVLKVTDTGPFRETAVGGAKAAQSRKRTPIQEAAETCGMSENVGDNGTSIEFDTEGEEDYGGDDYDDVECVLNALGVPDRVRSRIGHTRAIDGTQDAKWGDYEAFWNYHPDDGMNLTVFISE